MSQIDSDGEERDFIYRDMMYRWETERKFAPDPAIKHFVRADDFRNQLRLIADMLGDTANDHHGRSPVVEFEQLIDAFELIRHDGKWNDARLRGHWPGADEVALSMALDTATGLASDPMMSLREAIARAVAEHGVAGNSFEAACKRVERAYRARLSPVGHEPETDVP